MIKNYELSVKTEGNCDIVDITKQIEDKISSSEVKNGVITIFNVGSTAAITTIEYEPGLVNYDMASIFDKIAPQDAYYRHEETWHDDNGHAHVRASLVGPSLNIPIIEGKLPLGTWQQIVLIDFDTTGRTRTIICQIMGE